MDCNERNGTSAMEQIVSSEGVSTLSVIPIQIQSIDGISSGMGQIALSEMDPRFELSVIQIQSIATSHLCKESVQIKF